jgi:hypothetical protein
MSKHRWVSSGRSGLIPPYLGFIPDRVMRSQGFYELRFSPRERAAPVWSTLRPMP